MPLKFRQTGLPSPLDETRKDCTAFSGELPVGFIYYEVREGGAAERRTYRTVAASICIDELSIRLLLLCSKHYETELCSPRDGFSPAVRIELGENGGDVKLGGVEGDS